MVTMTASVMRRLLSAEKCTNLFAQLQELHEAIMRLMPEGAHALDPHRTIRQGLEREHRSLQRELEQESRSDQRELGYGSDPWRRRGR